MPTAWPRSSAPAGSREVRVKSAASHQIRALLSTRARLVAQRRELGLKLGGLLKTFGRPLGQVGPGRFEARVRELAAGIDDGLREAAEALLAVRERLAEPIARLDRLLRERARGDATCHRLMTVPGVGPLTALAFMTAVDDPERFAHSSSAGAYLGLTPRRSQAGAVDRPGRIAKCGAGLTRAYPVEAAPTLLTRVKRGSALAQGLHPARGGELDQPRQQQRVPRANALDPGRAQARAARRLPSERSDHRVAGRRQRSAARLYPPSPS